MKKLLPALTALFFICFAALLLSWIFTGLDVLFTLMLTFAVIAYHFLMRYAVGGIMNAALHNKLDYRNAWFRVRPAEQKLHTFLRVKKWKKLVRAYEPSFFDLRLHTAEEVIMATCQAELVHEIIMALSLLPMLLAVWFDGDAAFYATSLLALLIDSSFVAIQRFNRPRLLRLMEKRK